MSELGKNVTGQWIKATAAFGHTPHRVPVQMYVEGDDDVEFWKDAVEPYQSKYEIRVITNQAAKAAEQQEAGNGKTILLSMDGLCKEKVVAVDADFDVLIDCYSTHTEMVRSNPFVVNTTWYSVENILMQKTEHVSLLESFSLALNELFAYYLVTISSKVETRPAKHFGELLSRYGVERCANINKFDDFSSAYHTELQEVLETHKEDVEQEKRRLNDLGYTSSEIWKLSRGHNLWDMIVKPQIVNDYDNKITQKIQEQRVSGEKVDKIKAMNELGITTSVRDFVHHEFYYGNMAAVIVPAPTRTKLDSMFP